MSKKIVVCSDEKHPIHEVVIRDLQKRGFELVLLGALETAQDEPWPDVAEQAARQIVEGHCEEGIFFCWTGTGISIAANKVPGIRAALCTDPETAEGARIWNHANVLALSNRLMTPERVKAILEAWYRTPARDPQGQEGVDRLSRIEKRYLS